MDKLKRGISSSYTSIRSLWDRWTFQHDQGQEVIVDMANICRKLLKPKDPAEKDELLLQLDSKWKNLNVHIQRLTNIYNKISKERHLLVTLQDSFYNQDIHSQPSPIVFSNLTLSSLGLYISYYSKIVELFIVFINILISKLSSGVYGPNYIKI